MRKIPKIYDKRIICFDFDGTITKKDNYPKIYQSYNFETVKLIKKLSELNYKIIINSARDTLYFKDIEDFLKKNNIPYDEIHLKSKPTADFYIDDKGIIGSADDMEMFIESFFSNMDEYLELISSGKLSSNFMKNISNVPENPRYQIKKDNNFRIILPLTGGMDSTTLWKMLEESGENYVPYYVNMGQSYSELELNTIKEITGIIPKIINIDINFKQYKHILLGRNMIIILKLAEEFKKNNWWGEIWFGNIQGESPIINGDKSRKFFQDINKFLVYHNYDVRIQSPLIGMNKFDQVAYWKNRDINLFKETKCCFNDKIKQCGYCQSCFRKYVAFKYHNIDISDKFYNFNPKEHIKKYKNLMTKKLKNKDYTQYSKDRMIKTLRVIDELSE